MQKILAMIFCGLFILSLLLSVSDNLTSQIKSITGGNAYSASLVPIPPQPMKQDNLAAKKIEIENIK